MVDTIETEEIVEVYIEPDSYFQNALQNLKAGYNESVLTDLKKAIDFLQTVVYEYDTIHLMEFQTAANELNVLSKRIADGETVTEAEMNQTFANVDFAIGSYHIAVIEDFIVQEKKDEVSLVRLRRALIRTENSLKYTPIKLSASELEELDLVKNEVKKTKKPTRKLWNMI